MIALVVLLVLIIVGLVIWDRCVRETPPAEPPTAGPPRARFRPAQRPAPGPGQANGTRFQGEGVAPERPTRRFAQQADRFAPRGAAARFSGEVRRSPDAIGLACGRPIPECDRGADCLCVD